MKAIKIQTDSIEAQVSSPISLAAPEKKTRHPLKEWFSRFFKSSDLSYEHWRRVEYPMDYQSQREYRHSQGGV